MSRAYDMHLQVTEFKPRRRTAIKAEAQTNWPFEWFIDASDLLSGMGESSLCGGESEHEFAERLTKAIWLVNEGYCLVCVTATYLEIAPPQEEYTFDEADYERLQRGVEATK